jgi:hypothetical protein
MNLYDQYYDNGNESGDGSLRAGGGDGDTGIGDSGGIDDHDNGYNDPTPIGDAVIWLIFLAIIYSTYKWKRKTKINV